MAFDFHFKPYYRAREVAEMLGYHYGHVRRLVSTGRLYSVKRPNGARLIPHSEVVRWVEAIGSDICLVVEHADPPPSLV